MLAIASLASCFGKHDNFVVQNVIPMLASFLNSANAGMRNFVAFAVAEQSRNSDVVQILTDEGGLEAMLYLAQSDDKSVQIQVLQVLTRTFSLLDCKQIQPFCLPGENQMDFLKGEPFPLRQRPSLDNIDHWGNQVDF
jgi:hypothetical protein